MHLREVENAHNSKCQAQQLELELVRQKLEEFSKNQQSARRNMLDSDELDEIEIERILRKRERRKWEEGREMVPERDIEGRSKLTQIDRHIENKNRQTDKKNEPIEKKDKELRINRMENTNKKGLYREGTKSIESEPIENTERQNEIKTDRQRYTNISREIVDKERRKSMDSERIENLERDRRGDTSRDRRDSNSSKDMSRGRKSQEEGVTNRERKKIGEEKMFQLSLMCGSNEAELLDAPTKNVEEKRTSPIEVQKIDKVKKEEKDPEVKETIEMTEKVMIYQAEEKRKSFAQTSIRHKTRHSIEVSCYLNFMAFLKWQPCHFPVMAIWFVYVSLFSQSYSIVQFIIVNLFVRIFFPVLLFGTSNSLKRNKSRPQAGLDPPIY